MMSLRFTVVLVVFVMLLVETMAPGSLPADFLHSIAASLTSSGAVLEALMCVLMFGAAVQLRPRGSWRTVVLGGNLALLTTALAIALVAAATRWVCTRLGIELPLAYAFAFAALITPSEPLAMLRAVALGGSSAVGRRVMAEPLLACMLGLVIYEVALARADGVRGAISAMVLEQAGGALLLGACLGLAMMWVLRLGAHALLAAVAAAGTVLACWYAGQTLPLNGPLAAACAGLLMAFQRDEAFGDGIQRARLELWSAWVANLLAALLPIALGVVLVTLEIPGRHLAAAAFLLPLVVLLPRILAAASIWLFGLRHQLPDELPRIAAWTGMRGGFAVVLVLMLAQSADVALIAVTTFAVLVFSLLLQWPAFGLYLASKRPLDPASKDDERLDEADQRKPVSE
jgi:CPA1 family monovalent cation:H+ antiporter